MAHQKKPTTPKVPSPLSPASAPRPVASQPKANATFRAVEGYLHRRLMNDAMKNKAAAAVAAFSDPPPGFPIIPFVCQECEADPCIPCRNKKSCRTLCLFCCECSDLLI
ncbi:hypothetical protein MVEG_07892 [Podila verticillata NRRL 6337]|nr:hypothetical protein MVEG_07892 [Podila verticillata NRRL 6337]